LPGAAELAEKMKTYALAVHACETPKTSNFIEFYKSRAFDDSPPLPTDSQLLEERR
jgi:hypothetical protein